MEHLANQIGAPTQDRAAYEIGIHGIVDRLALFPGLVLMLVVLSVNLLGDVRRDVLDPRTKRLTD
jgi:ABC-type dipeptide/oligopeptide/nickel transport system permease subunit